jgi:hypothetical protein
LKNLIVPFTFGPGDVFEVIRTYTAGGAATLVNNKVVLEPAIKDFLYSGL